ncbi:MAG: glycosyltransferase family 4 protein [Candidatus Promineifilaceae bacterium]
MRIVFIGPFGFHPNKTMAVRALPLAKALVKAGHRVHLIMPPWQTPEEANRHWQEAGVTNRYVSLSGGIVPTTIRMVRETLALQPDVVHCFKPKAYAGLAAWWLWYTHCRHFKLFLDTDDWEGWGGWNDIAPYSWLQKHFFAWQEQWGLTHNHGVTAASRELARMAAVAGAKRVVYVPNGAGVAPKRQMEAGTKAVHLSLPFPDGPVLLVYSRLFEFDTKRLVAVLAGVKTAVSHLNILMVGAGLYSDDAAQFRQQLEAAGLTGHVKETGWVEPDKLPALLASADVGIYLMDNTLLNRTKCPVKLADMVAAGVPVVGEDVGQVGEYVVNGRTGYLHPTGDVPALTRSIITLLTTPNLRTQFSTAARAHYNAHFQWEHLAQIIENFYTNNA